MIKKANFAQRLKELREEKGMTQRSLAIALGVSQGAIKNWESGMNGTNIQMVIKIAEFFGVETDQLLGRTDI